MRRFARAVTSVALVVALMGAVMVAAPTAAGASSPPDEAEFVSKINALRGSLGLAPLTPDGALAATACVWNDQMIAADGISHDPNLAAAIGSAVPNWRKGGENVGMGGTVSSLFDAFVASPGHYKNLVDPDFSRVGVCVGRDGSGKLFTTHRFVAVGNPAPPPPPTTAAPPPPTPPPTAPPTTAPPTTPAPPPPTTAPPPPPTAPPTAPPTTAAPATTHSPPPTTTPATTAAATPPASPLTSLLVAALPSSTPAAESTLAPSEDVHALIVEILDLFPAFLHLRLP